MVGMLQRPTKALGVLVIVVVGRRRDSMVHVEGGRRVTLALAVAVMCTRGGVGWIPVTHAQSGPDLRSIVGTWEGPLKGQVGVSYPVRLTIKDDGTWEMLPLNGDTFRHYSGTVRVVEGRLRFYTFEDGRIGAFTLNENNGQQVLQLQTNDQTIQAEMTRK